MWQQPNLLRPLSMSLVQEGGGWAGIQIVAEAYGHLAQSHVDDALRETGDCLITKFWSSPFLLKKPETDGQDSGTFENGGDLIDALRERHSVEIAGKSVVGARGIEPLTPSMSRKCSTAELSAQ